MRFAADTCYSDYTQWRSRVGEGGSSPPRNPGKFAKDGEQPKPHPAIRIDSSRKL